MFIDGVSVVRHPRMARSALGVCPQFTAIDSQLSVREHLIIYGRLKGLAHKGQELEKSVEAILHCTALNMYADRLATSSKHFMEETTRESSSLLLHLMETHWNRS